MDLTKSERARLTDCAHSIQSAQASLTDIDETKLPGVDEIQECLKGADKNLRHVLRQEPGKKETLA